MNIHVNGEPREVKEGVTIAALIEQIGLDPKKVAVERNREIVPRATLRDVAVEDGDTFEIVHFVGGG
ncbi:sulfur carrier protein ThiS [Sphingomicrobium sediminis]|uniref:Sulfur carrier protein ThiS n=1 Tax=Sphingomicrobium sediminis TaxID=2950949 RepID=A0A9X2J233_9SPHN|nr:sulfur carrier protein ThiS [Sphingomicrobium sediminis]